MKFKKIVVFFFCLFLLHAGIIQAVQEFKIPRAPDQWTTDRASFLNPSTITLLNQRLSAFEQQTGHQILVYINRTTGEVPIEEWAVKAFEAWRVGRKGIDDGLVIFIFTEDRQVRIEVGYGLEEKIPDAMAYRIINNILAPGFRSGRQDEAVVQAVTEIMATISGEKPLIKPEVATEREGPASPLIPKIIFGFLLLFFIIIFLTNPTLAIFMLLNIISGDRSGRVGKSSGDWFRGGGFFGGSGGGFSGGGFRGGGGMSGGGGASGSW